jgi:phosphoenolpyruvate carboxylase
VASFTNQTFVDQKEFILERYLEFAKELIDKLTPALSHTSVSEKLTQSIKKDAKDFPYISNIKPQEPYRAKLRYIIEKLENTLQRVREVKKRAGETIHPLLGQTLVGPSGYNLSHELQQDIDTMYASLLEHEGKAQARSLVQDFKILVDTFGFHLCSIDFRQTSDKNFAAVKEYLAAIGHNAAENLSKFSESDKQKLLLSLITADQIELDPWVIPQLSKISRDTIETMLIFADAARTDSRAVGKFIISMCQSASDILIILFLFKLVGMLECQSNTISFCPFDVCGLFETIEDLKSAPRIVEQLFAIPMFRDYIVKLRGGKFTVMLGYSDSVKDGSALASDAEIARVSFALKILEDELNAKYDPIQRIQFIFYRGRGDTIPRGYGGSITKAICSQLVTQRAEDHTEQNRYLRKYASVTSAVDHLHSVYSAHVTAQVREISPLTSVYQNFFEFFGTISFLHWNTLVRGSRGKTYFNILKKFSILPHLHKSHFASRPITREGTDYDIETIRAIPFVMTLSQLREFTSAYYGTGTAFEEGQRLLDDHYGTALQLLRAHLSMIGENAQVVESFQQQLLAGDFAAGNESLGQLIRLMFPDKLSSKQAIEDFFTEVKKMEKNKFLASILERYHGPDASNQIAFLIVYLKEQNFSVLELLRKMYREYPPFRYSIENKETALLIRNKRIVDCYTNEISDEERQVLDDTEREAQLTKKWILNINQQKELESKTLTQDFNSAELFLLHKIQSKYMSLFRQLTSKKQHLLKYKTEQGDAEAKSLNAQLELLSIFIQMTILAISEALGFGG